MAELFELLLGQRLSRDVHEVRLSRTTMLPVNRRTRFVAETLVLADSLGKHRRVVLLADDPIAPSITLKKRRGQPKEAKATSALPSDELSNSTGVLPSNNCLEPRQYVSFAMVT